MIVEIMGILCASIVTLVCGSLVLVDRVARLAQKDREAIREEIRLEQEQFEHEDGREERDKKEKQEREERAAKIAIKRAAGVVVEPYFETTLEERCPKCGKVSSSTELGCKLDAGIIKIPSACPDPDLCEAGDQQHMHVSCVSCHSTWFIRPMNYVEKK